MGILKTWGRVMASPFTSPAKEMVASAGRIRQQVADIKQVRERQAQQNADVDALIAGHTPEEKFAILVRHHGWSEPALELQAIAARRARLGMLGLAAVGGVSLLWVAAQAGGVGPALVMATMATLLVAACGVRAAKFAWYEHELTTRTLMPLREFLSREDLFARICRIGA